MLDYRACRLCPRQCGVDRTRGQRGYCGMGDGPVAARAAAHYWEEPVISGSFGSGAVFFSGCTLGCRFCQNAQISRGGFGAPLDTARLRRIFLRLVDEGCQNINLVTPTHFLPSILPALEPKLPVPVVYNCGGYERVQTLRQLEGKIDVYLPDLKYSDSALAARLSAAPDYFQVATAAIEEMYRQTGPCRIVDGELRRGVLIRHLVLPGCVDNSLGVVEWIARRFAPGQVLVSVMSQYTPVGRQEPPLDRPVTAEEYAAVLSWMQLCGLHDGYMQDSAAASCRYIPEFNLEGLE